MEQYHTWASHGNSNKFSLCQVQFILSTMVKRTIFQRDSEQQMICMARQSLVNKVSRRQRVDMNLLFLNIKVRRAQLLNDSLDEEESVPKEKAQGDLHRSDRVRHGRPHQGVAPAAASVDYSH